MKQIVVKSMLYAAAFITMAACSNPSGKVSPAQEAETVEEIRYIVTEGTAVIKEVPQDESYSSSVLAYATNNIAPQSGGRIQKINVEVGDFVSKGQVLAQMDKVQLEQARLSLVKDSTEFSRMQALYAEGGLAKSDLETMELSYNVRKSTYENLLENTILRAPISGVITARNYDRGDMYGMAQPIFVLQQITPVKLLVGVSESDYSKIQKGDEAEITVDAIPDKVFTGKINRIYPTIDEKTRTVKVEIIVNNSDRVLRPGMYAKVVLNFGSNTSVVVPDAAVTKQQGSGQRIVYVIKDDNTVELRMVKLGRFIDGEYEILSGVNDGEKVVTSGQNPLRSGAKIKVVESN